MIQQNVTNSYTEIYIGGGNWLTQSGFVPAHTFVRRKILLPGESVDDYREVTDAERLRIEAEEGARISPPQWLIDVFEADPNGGVDRERMVFTLHGLTLSTQEAIATAMRGNKLTGNSDYCGLGAAAKIRTNLTPVNSSNASYCRSYDYLFRGQTQLEVAVLSGYNNKGGTELDIPGISTMGTMYGMFDGCASLRKVLGRVYMVYAGVSTLSNDAFRGCVALEDIWLNRIRADINMQDCGRLSLWTMQTAIRSAHNSKPITFTVHPDIYAKLTDEADTEWHQVLVDAAARDIIFATI